MVLLRDAETKEPTEMKKRTLLVFVVTAIAGTQSLAQNGGYLLINNNDIRANSVDVDTVSTTGELHRVSTLSTGGFGGVSQFGTTYTAVGQNLKCFFISNGGSSDIASFQIPSLHKVAANFSNPGLVGSAALAASPDGKFLYTAWGGSIAILSINADCSLILSSGPISQPNYITSIAVAPTGKTLVVSYVNEGYPPLFGGAQAYSIDEATGTLTALGPELVFADEISECGNCSPSGLDVTADGKFWVWGNDGLSAPTSTLSAVLGPGGFSQVAMQQYPENPVGAVFNVWFSPAGRSGNGNLYLSGSSVTGHSAGIIVTTFNSGTITYVGTTTNDDAYYTGNVQTIGNSGTGSPITIVWSSFIPVQFSTKSAPTNVFTNTVQSYAVNGTTLEPSSSLNTTSRQNYSLSTSGAGK